MTRQGTLKRKEAGFAETIGEDPLGEGDQERLEQAFQTRYDRELLPTEMVPYGVLGRFHREFRAILHTMYHTPGLRSLAATRLRGGVKKQKVGDVELHFMEGVPVEQEAVDSLRGRLKQYQLST